MSKQTASAHWTGTLKEGKGTFEVGSKLISGNYTFATRFESVKGTNPEELIGAAHSACYSMFLSALLSNENLTPDAITTQATVTLATVDGGPKITLIHLDCQAKVSGIDADAFAKVAQTAKEKCPISRLFEGTEITLNAKLI